jgi:hypothetical protein
MKIVEATKQMAERDLSYRKCEKKLDGGCAEMSSGMPSLAYDVELN